MRKSTFNIFLILAIYNAGWSHDANITIVQCVWWLQMAVLGVILFYYFLFFFQYVYMYLLFIITQQFSFKGLVVDIKIPESVPL